MFPHAGLGSAWNRYELLAHEAPVGNVWIEWGLGFLNHSPAELLWAQKCRKVKCVLATLFEGFAVSTSITWKPT